jgi:hypothetical protein
MTALPHGQASALYFWLFEILLTVESMQFAARLTGETALECWCAFL